MISNSATQLAISDWVNHLASVPEREFTQQNVHDFITGHSLDLDSLKPYLRFSHEHYTRNLIFRNEVFECLALCWEIGQSSPIHDHHGQTGWIYLATGKLFVQDYRIEERDSVCRTCRVVPTSSAELGVHGDALVDKEEEVHKVSNLGRYNQRAISLHVYSKPVSTCEIYLPEKGTYQEVSLACTSEFGRLTCELPSA